MDFHGMKRKDLQALCKKHGIPANLKNIDMASRLTSVFEKETEETFTDSLSLSEDSVLKDDLVVKKVRFSPENEVFEFTRSVKRCQRKNVRKRSKGINVRDLQGSRIELRRSKRIVSSGSFQENCKVTGLMALEKLEFEDPSEGLSGNDQDGFKLEKIGRRSTRLTSKAGTLLPSKRSKLLVDTEDKEDESVKNNVKEVVSMDFVVQETGKCHRKDVQDDPKVEKVHRRSRRLVNEIDVQTNTQDQRRSIRLKARAVNTSMGGKESKEERKTTKQSKRSMVVNTQEGQLVKNEPKESLIDCEVQTTEDYRRMNVQDVSIVEKVFRRSKRRCNDINVLMDLGVKKAPKQSRQHEKSLTELLVDGQAQKGDKQPKRTFGNGREDKKLLRISTHTTLDNMEDKSEERLERDTVLIAAVKEKPQGMIENSPFSSDTKAAESVMITENVVDSEPEKAVDSSQRTNTQELNSELMKDKSEEGLERDTVLIDAVKEKPQGMIENSPLSSDTKAAESVMITENVLDSKPEKAVDSSQRTNTQELNYEPMEDKSEERLERDTVLIAAVKEKPRGMIENSPFSSDTKAAESVMITETVLDSEPEKAVDSSQRANTQELNSELMEDKSEKRLERDTVLIAAVKENKNEVSSCSILLSERLSPASVQCSVSNSKAELIFVKDSASTVIGENTKTKEEILICPPISELKEHSSVEAMLENSAECWKENYPNKDDEKHSLEKEVQAANLHGNFYESNTENNSAEEEMKTTSETKAAEPVMISEKSSVDISPGGNTQELHSELMEGEREEKHEQDTVLMTAIKEKVDSSSLSLFLIERSEVSNPEVEIFVETTPPPTSVLSAVSNPEAELGDPTPHILVKDIASEVIAKEDIKTKKEILISTPRFEVEEHSFVAKLAEAEECRDEIQSSKDGETGSLKKTVQSENLHGNFSGYNTQNSKVGCISFGDCVNLETLNEVKDESLEKSEQRSSFERGCKLNALELRGCSSTHFTSHSLKENNVSKCFEVDKTKALSLPLPRNNDSSAFDELVIFTTPERKLMLMEQISEKGKTLAADSVTQHNDEAVESHALVFTTPQQVSTLGDAGTCSMVSEEPVPSTDIQNQVHDPLEGLAITTDELIEAKETKNIQIGFEGNLLLNSSGGYYVSGKTCILAGTEDEDDAVGPVATVFEKAISLTPDEFIVQNNMNEKDKEMFRRETTPSPEKTLNASPETRKEYLNIDESGALSERQVRREPILIYRTQVKPQRHDMKENAPNSKIEHNLNMTAPRTSKRQPLQDLKKI